MLIIRNVLSPIRWYYRGISQDLRLCHLRPFSSRNTQQPIDDNDDDKPIKFSSSLASRYRASTTNRGQKNTRLWYEPYVIMASISVFMIYFTILREENDIDAELKRSLYSRIDGLEEFQLRQSLKYNETHGLETRDITKRLQELETIKNVEE